METRANFILVGAFTLLGIIGSLGFFVWLSSVQLDRQYSTYGILFDDVTGLAASGDVVFNGINVGRVISVGIDDEDPSKVYVGIEVAADTPVREDTTAQLSSSGVTGVSFIALSNSQINAAPLTAEDGSVPIIPSRRSTVQQLVEDAPDLITEATALLRQFQTIASPENQAYLQNILRNLDSASGELDQALADFSDITGTVDEATAQITQFTSRLDDIGAVVETTLTNTDETLDAANGAFSAIESTVSTSDAAIQSAQAAFAQAETLMRDDIPGIVTDISETVAALNTAVVDIAAQSGDALSGFTQTAKLANSRLEELEQTLAAADLSFAAVTGAANDFDALVKGDASRLIAEARDVLGTANRALSDIQGVIETDVPVVVADVRGAVATASRALEQVATDLTGLSGKLDPLTKDAQGTLRAATDIFERAGQTLDGLDGTLAAADGALGSAEAAFDAASSVLTTDLDPTLNDIRDAAAQINGAAAQVSSDLPAVTTDLRNLIARADAVVGQVQSVVGQTAPGVSSFAETGLPELTRLGAEARSLVRSLDQLVRRIDRDPARFLLDDRVPEYRR